MPAPRVDSKAAIVTRTVEAQMKIRWQNAKMHITNEPRENSTDTPTPTRAAIFQPEFADSRQKFRKKISRFWSISFVIFLFLAFL